MSRVILSVYGRPLDVTDCGGWALLERDALDVGSIAACIDRCRARGLRVVKRKRPVHDYASGWRSVESLRFVAPVGVHPMPLDEDPHADRVLSWIWDACHVEPAEDIEPVIVAAWIVWLATGRVPPVFDRAMRDYAGSSPELAMLPAIRDAILAAAGYAPAPAPAAVVAPVSVEDAASTLGWSVEALRAAMRRGDVRSVAAGRRRMVPWDELERLVVAMTSP